MAKPINKRTKREVKNNFGRYAGLLLIIILCIGFATSFMTSAESVRTTYTHAADEGKLEDGYFISYNQVEKSVIDEIESKGMDVYEQFYYDYQIEDSVSVRIFDERSEVNKPTVVSGEWSGAENEILVDVLFAEAQEIEIGDILKLGKSEFIVSGFAAFPDYIVSLENISDMLADRNTFGVAMISKTAFERVENEDFIYNYSLRLGENDNAAKIDNVMNDVKEILMEQATLSEFVQTSNNSRITGVENKVDSYSSVAKVFLIIVTLIIAFLFTVISAHTIEEDAAVLGVLLASGYSKKEIILHYLRLPFFITLFSSLLGSVLGHTVLINLPARSIYSYDSLPELVVELNITTILLTVLLPVFLVTIINLIVIANKLRLTPLRLLRKDLKQVKSKEGIQLSKFSFQTRFRLRVIFRSKGNYLMLFGGILLAGWLLMFGMGMSTSFDIYTETLGSVWPAEYQYILKTPIDISTEEAEKAVVYTFTTQFNSTDRELNITVLGVEDDSVFFKELSLPEDKNAFVTSDALQKKLNLETGDSVKFYDDINDETYALTVSGTYEFPSGLYIFMKKENLLNLLDYEENYFNTLFADSELDINENYLTTILTRDDVSQNGKQMKELMQSIINLLIAVSVLCYLIIMYLLTKMVIDKNALNISLMKVFGYESKEVKKMYLSQTTVVIFVSLLISLPIQYLLMCTIWPTMTAALNGYVEFIPTVQVFLTIAVIGIVSYLLINILHVKYVRKIDMTEALKDRE